MKIVPFNFIDDLEKASIRDKESYIGIDEISITYVQPADTNSLSDDIQNIKITSRQPCSVSEKDSLNKEGFYFNIEIPENMHWSVSDGEELKCLVDDFKNRLYQINKW